jgi:hypothetical protein
MCYKKFKRLKYFDVAFFGGSIKKIKIKSVGRRGGEGREFYNSFTN